MKRNSIQQKPIETIVSSFQKKFMNVLKKALPPSGTPQRAVNAVPMNLQQAVFDFEISYSQTKPLRTRSPKKLVI